MNRNSTLDTFETALLAQLRRQVAEHPEPQPAPVPPRRRRRARLVAAAGTAVAASVVAVFGLGSTGGSPAYAVEQDADGDVVVTVHRLDDAAGLEAALKANGIDADVSYDADRNGTSFGIAPDGEPGPADEVPSPPTGAGGGPTSVEGGATKGHDDDGPSLSQGGSGVEPAQPGDPADDPCGMGKEPATLTHEGSEWVLRIPADSPLQDRHVDIGTDANGGLSVLYAGDQPGSACGLMSMGAPPQ